MLAEGPRPRGAHGGGKEPRRCKLGVKEREGVGGRHRGDAVDGTSEQRHRLGREAPSAPFTSASISAIFAKVPLMVTTGRGDAGLHTT